MDNKRKFKIFGWVELLNSLMEIVLSSLTNLLSMYYILTKERFARIFLFFWTPLSLLLTFFLIAVDVTQMKKARELIRAGKEDVGGDEMEKAWKKWILRNRISRLVVFIWCLGFGTVEIYQQDFYIFITFAMFLGAAMSRVMVNCGMNKIEFAQENRKNNDVSNKQTSV